MRIRAIDSFRGLSIILMVFFTLTLRFSRELPDALLHNAEDSVHFGDFVLPMFLFASGMSLVFFAKKREKESKTDYILDILERFFKLVFISFFLTPFSAGALLQMDEVMLSAVLFIPAIILVGFSEIVVGAVAIAVMIVYLVLQHFMMLPDFTGYYLGGYPAGFFYLPVMLAGVIAGKRINELEKFLGIALAVTFVLLLLVPPYKLDASPSFMGLAVVLSLCTFLLVRNMESKPLEYLGRKPIRYWVLMFVVLLIPMGIWAALQGYDLPLELDWAGAVVLSLLGLPVLYAISKTFDAAEQYLSKAKPSSGKKKQQKS